MSDHRLDELLDSGLIEEPVFQQILDMDDDDDNNEFSRSIVYDFFDQAQTTFDKMDSALEEKDLKQLSDLGHFLKGSSAALGMTKVKASCEIIQQLGAKKDESGSRSEPNDAISLSKLEKQIAVTKLEYEEVEKELRRFYGE
jgi:osomolarity two-component system phosphorelay intermediate protein YPD1